MVDRETGSLKLLTPFHHNNRVCIYCVFVGFDSVITAFSALSSDVFMLYCHTVNGLQQIYVTAQRYTVVIGKCVSA